MTVLCTRSDVTVPRTRSEMIVPRTRSDVTVPRTRSYVTIPRTRNEVTVLRNPRRQRRLFILTRRFARLLHPPHLHPPHSSTSLCHITANQNQHSIDVNFKMESIEVHYNPMAVRNILDFVGEMKERHQQQVQLIPPSPTKRQTSFTRSASRMINTKSGAPTNEASPLPPTNLSFEFKR